MIDHGPRRPAIRALAEGDLVAAIGDVHGHADLLEAMHAALADEIARIRPEAATVVHLGDLVDRGPENRRTVELARAGVAGARNLTLMGNHEERFLAELAGRDPPQARWYAMGGRELLAECGAEPVAGWQERVRAHFGDDLLAWMAACPRRYRHGPLLFVHAGIDPERPLAMQDPHTLLWVRETWWHHPGPYPEDVAVIHGHVPVPEVDLGHPRRLAIDTRAHAGGRLTALVIDGGRMCTLTTRRV
ncbi:MAG: metallophosphoesterase [Siculibacillus sp.]|nr:metallophosphoesterase [Siculibacillus sp.]